MAIPPFDPITLSLLASAAAPVAAETAGAAAVAAPIAAETASLAAPAAASTLPEGVSAFAPSGIPPTATPPLLSGPTLSGPAVTAGKVPPPAPGMNLSEGLSTASGALHLASKLIKNKDAKTTLNLMSMASGAGGNAKDPQALMKSLEGPIGDISDATTEEAELKQKKLSELLPPPNLQQQAPAATPSPPSGPAPATLPSSRLTPDFEAENPLDRLRSIRGV